MIREKRIIVTGGTGFLGSQIVSLLNESNRVFVPRSTYYDLKEKEAAKQLFVDFPNVDIVIHAAADVGGIGYSKTHPGSMFYNNMLINMNMVHQSYMAKVKKFVGIGSVCEYPANTSIPFKEENIWKGYPVSTNDAYGFAKRMMLAQCNGYRKQYNFNSIHLVLENLYGPKDDFDLKNSHVIPALIRKIVMALDADEKSVDVWGSGDESREFLYVKDAAKAIVMASEKYDKPDPVNIGTGEEIRICDLAKIIGNYLGYTGKFHYLNNGLGGQQRRLLDISRAKIQFGFEASTGLEDGLKETIHYYLDHREELDKQGEEDE